MKSTMAASLQNSPISRHMFYVVPTQTDGFQEHNESSPEASQKVSRYVSGIQKYNSFNVADTKVRQLQKLNSETFLELTKKNLDGSRKDKQTQVCILSSDWSRYAHDSNQNVFSDEKCIHIKDIVDRVSLTKDNSEKIVDEDYQKLMMTIDFPTNDRVNNDYEQLSEMTSSRTEEPAIDCSFQLYGSDECHIDATFDKFEQCKETKHLNVKRKRKYEEKRRRPFELLPSFTFCQTYTRSSELMNTERTNREQLQRLFAEHNNKQNALASNTFDPFDQSARSPSYPRNIKQTRTAVSTSNSKSSTGNAKLSQSASITNSVEKADKTVCVSSSANMLKASQDSLANKVDDKLKGDSTFSIKVDTKTGNSDKTEIQLINLRMNGDNSLHLVQADEDRPQSTSTSGYSTDELSCKTSDSLYVFQSTPSFSEKLFNKYFIIHDGRSIMALQVDNSQLSLPRQNGENRLTFFQNVAMSDVPIPDKAGWLTNVEDQTQVWGVVLDMLFCVFPNESAIQAQKVIVLPGCNIRQHVYKSAIKGINSGTHCQTISGLSRFQIVIDECTDNKHVFGFETGHELDTWYKVLKTASTVDSDVTIDFRKSKDNDAIILDTKRLSLDNDGSKATYVPTTQDYPNRTQKMNSPKTQSETCSNTVNGQPDDADNSISPVACSQPSPSCQILVRQDSTRRSITDFKRRLRREPEPEVTKHHPIRAQHFEPKQQTQQATQQQSEKKMSSFGSLESLFNFKRKKRKSSVDSNSISNDDSGSVSSDTISVKDKVLSKSIDINSNKSQLNKNTIKRLSRSLEFGQSSSSVNNNIIQRASDKVFSQRPAKPSVKLRDLQDISLNGFLRYKYHLKWRKLWSIVCRGCFYGFKSQSPEETAHLIVVLANCTVVYVTEKAKKKSYSYMFKLQQERSKGIYLCVSDYNDLMRWLSVLQMESNSVITDLNTIRRCSDSQSESNCSLVSRECSTPVPPNDQTESTEKSRSRPRKKKDSPKSHRHSSCPPILLSESACSKGTFDCSFSDDTQASVSVNSTDTDVPMPNENVPKYDKALTHVWQNDRGYLFNVIRTKLSAYRHKQDPIYNKDLPWLGKDGLLIQNSGECQDSRVVQRSRSFNLQTQTAMTDTEPKSACTVMESSLHTRKRHKPLVVKKIPAAALQERQTCIGYMEKKSYSRQWIKYWFVLHEGSLFCYLTSDDSVTVDILNLHGYNVTMLVDKFRGKKFVIQLSHENFTSLYLSTDSRKEMESWFTCFEKAIEAPSGVINEIDKKQYGDACAGNESKTEEKTKLVKQKLLQEMLRQKYELEKKQAERQKKTKSKNTESPDLSHSTLSSPEVISHEQRTCNLTRLQQRRMSTQLKLDSIQKQLDKPGVVRKGIFGFGKSKKPDENKNIFLQDQLKELHDKLQKINTDFSQVSKGNNADNIDVNQNRKSMPEKSMTSSVSSIEKSPDSDDDDVKANSMKSTMKKWTNKTLFKASLKKKSGTTSKQMNGSLPNLCDKINVSCSLDGDLNNGDDCTLYSDGDNNVGPNIIHLTEPKVDFQLELSSSQDMLNRSASSSPPQYIRSNSKGSTISSLSSPRREIAPSTLAEIDAFEEMTRQVLGARSMELQNK